MKIKELLLAVGEHSDVNRPCGVDTYSLERRTMRDRGDDDPAAVFEPDKPTIEEVINARRQKQIHFHRSVALRLSSPAKACNCWQPREQNYRRR
jgi:hypothetical protein